MDGLIRSPILLLAALGLLVAGVACAATVYVSPDGRPEGDGSAERPWPSVQFALEKVGGGQTVIMKPGQYPGDIKIDVPYAGTPDSPTIIRAQEKWRAVVIGGQVHCIWTEPGCHDVVIDGLQCLGARFDGVKLLGDRNTVRNCWIHNNTTMGVAAFHSHGQVIERNLIEFNGSHPYYHHGVYANGDGLTIRYNIVRHNAGYGLHLYAEITNSAIYGNLVHGHSKPEVILACPEGGGKNRFVHNTLMSSATEPLDISQGKGEIIANNILVGKYGAISLYKCEAADVTIRNNLCEPACALGQGNCDGDPKFVDVGRDVFWLGEGSAAVGKGAADYALETDFWGRPADRTRPPDVGCFPFVAALARPAARASWYYQWPYEFYPNKEMGLPDLWALPPE